MTPVLLAIQAAAFALWAYLMVRSLLRLRARAVARSGKAMPGLSETLEGFGAFLTEPGFRTDRRQLGATTLALFALIFLNLVLAQG